MGENEEICIKETTDAGDLKQDPFLQNLSDKTLLPSIYRFKVVSKYLLLFEHKLCQLLREVAYRTQNRCFKTYGSICQTDGQMKETKNPSYTT